MEVRGDLENVGEEGGGEESPAEMSDVDEPPIKKRTKSPAVIAKVESSAAAAKAGHSSHKMGPSQINDPRNEYPRDSEG